MKIISTLPPQMTTHYLRPKFWQRVRNRDYPWVKPKGGLWTSTYTPLDPDGPCDWYRWSKAEDFRMYEWRHPHVYTVSTQLKIIEIDSQQDLVDLLSEYRDPNRFGYSDPDLEQQYPDWAKLARDGFDAVHLTERGQWATRLVLTGPDLYGWDCESTLWLNLYRRTFTSHTKHHMGWHRGEGGSIPTRKQLRERHHIQMYGMRAYLQKVQSHEMQTTV